MSLAPADLHDGMDVDEARPESEGEGDVIAPGATVDDSSEEEDSDPDEERRVREGFIVDEDEDDADEEEVRRHKKRRKRRKHSRNGNAFALLPDCNSELALQMTRRRMQKC